VNSVREKPHVLFSPAPLKPAEGTKVTPLCDLRVLCERQGFPLFHYSFSF
jgi:hypothetical protein